MRKYLFSAVVLTLCGMQCDAFAAPRRGANNANNNVQTATTQQSGTVSARAGKRQTVVPNTGAKAAPTAGANVGNVAARAGKKQTVKQGTVVARAGATQKAINTGTKVATATENTTVPEECQDALYGCMDAFCMLDNASGGRCQCSDRVTELDAVLEDILKLDEQTYLMATEGVERIQMGESADQIMARAKAAGDKAVKDNKSEENKKKVRTLDLSAWNNTIFDEVDDVFGDDSSTAINTFADKKGDALYRASAKMCAEQIPEQCKSYNSMMQLVYAQKIKSDCIAYENSLKAQKNQSQQKLRTAQKALRDAALEEYQNENKYATTGECVIAFTNCMKTTAECGDDYTGCVTLAANENVKGTTSGSKAKQTTIKGAVAGADIKLAASTLEQLLAKKDICESVTKQCVNANKGDAVWKSFLRNAAPALKSAELIAEQNLRSNCIPTAVDCFKTACKAQFGENEENYDMCLADPGTYKSLCKIQLEPCLEATGGSYEYPEKSSLWEGLRAALNSLKVDACTAQVKSCITEYCGDDYAGCIGLDTETIGDLCPYQKLTACMDRYATSNKTNDVESQVRAYVAEIAKGLALQIDTGLSEVCQNAATEAMIAVCGDTESCDIFKNDTKVGTDTLSYQICAVKDIIKFEPILSKVISSGMILDEEGIAADTCKSDISLITGQKLADNYGMFSPVIAGVVDWSKNVTVNEKGEFVCNGNDNCAIIDSLNATLTSALSRIKSNPKVEYCMTGREVQGFDKTKLVAKKAKTSNQNDEQNEKTKDDSADQVARFPNLLSNYGTVIADEILANAIENYDKKFAELQEQSAKDSKELGKTYPNSEQDKINAKICKSKSQYDDLANAVDNYRVRNFTRIHAEYNYGDNTCTVTTEHYHCQKWVPIVALKKAERKKGGRCSVNKPKITCNGSAPGAFCLTAPAKTETIQM